MASVFRKKLHALYNQLPAVGRYSEIPSGWIDRMDLEEPSSWMGKIRYFIRKRLIFITLFPALAAIDVVTSFISAGRHFWGALFTSDKRQANHIQQTQTYATLFSKNLLGLFFSLLGLFSPKLVSFFFVPAKDSAKIESGGSLYASDADMLVPVTKEVLQEIIRSAYAEGNSLMVVGAARSQGKQFLPQGQAGKKSVIVDLKELNDIKIDHTNKIATVGAGVRWVDLQLKANKQKLALKVMQASNVFSVGGSIGTNIHGWDHRSGTLANVIRSVRIITPQGEEKVIDRDNPKFGQILGGFGLFGVVVSADIELTDNEQLLEKGTAVSIDDYVTHFRDNVERNDDIRMHLFRLSLDPNNLLGDGVAVDYVKKADSIPLCTPDDKIQKEGDRGTRMDRLMVNVARRLGAIRKWYWAYESKRLVAKETPMTTNEVMQPPINAIFNDSVSESEWLQEYFLPEENLAAFIKDLARLLMVNEVALINSSVRFVKKDSHTALGYATEGDRFAVVLCFNQSLNLNAIIKTKKWIREANDLVIKHGGTFYLPYQQFASQEQFEAAYGKERIEAFAEAKRDVDPTSVFNSGLYQQYMVPKAPKPNYFKEMMRSEDMKKKFTGFLENVLQRVDAREFFSLLEDIIKYNDTHEEIYAELLRRLPDVMPGAIGSLRRILGSLSAIKRDLTAQAKALMPDVKTIDGLVEIGYPGRFVSGFKSEFKVTGRITAVYEQQSLTDYVQTGFPRPYDTFVKLDYNAPDLSSIASESADVITCYVGLHHFPQEQLEPFLQNVRRILRPNGRFLLVDHDAHDDESILMANMAHSVFNAANGTSLEEEMTEIRNFQSIDYWKALLTQNGLGQSDLGIEANRVRKGDPSLNTMMSFVKPMPNPMHQLGGQNRVTDQAQDNPPVHTPSLFQTPAAKTMDRAAERDNRLELSQ